MTERRPSRAAFPVDGQKRILIPIAGLPNEGMSSSALVHTLSPSTLTEPPGPDTLRDLHRMNPNLLQTLGYEVSEGIATLTLNRPEKLNAFTVQMRDEMIAAFDETDRDDASRSPRTWLTRPPKFSDIGAIAAAVATARHGREFIFVIVRLLLEGHSKCTTSTFAASASLGLHLRV